MSNYRLRKKQKIKRSYEFNEFFQKGDRLNSQNILLLARNCSSKKYGFAVSQKIRGAVKRNRAKRLLKEVIRLNQDILPEKKSLILVAKPGIEKIKFENLVHEFKELISSIDLKNNS